MAEAKAGVLKALIDGVLTELNLKVGADQVYLDDNTVATDKIAEMEDNYTKLVVGSSEPTERCLWFQVPVSRTVIMAEQTLTFTESGDIYFCQTSQMIDSIVDGANYIVVWDGTEYNCTAKQDGSIFLGNIFLATGTTQLDTGEPFCFMLMSDMTAIATDDTTTDSHTVAIYQ